MVIEIPKAINPVLLAHLAYASGSHITIHTAIEVLEAKISECREIILLMEDDKRASFKEEHNRLISRIKKYETLVLDLRSISLKGG